jgi:hypothetical protein
LTTDVYSEKGSVDRRYAQGVETVLQIESEEPVSLACQMPETLERLHFHGTFGKERVQVAQVYD